MKLVLISNLNDETVDEMLLAENVHPNFAKDILEMWNAKFASETSKYYCQVKQDEYKLYKWEP